MVVKEYMYMYDRVMVEERMPTLQHKVCTSVIHCTCAHVHVPQASKQASIVRMHA